MYRKIKIMTSVSFSMTKLAFNVFFLFSPNGMQVHIDRTDSGQFLNQRLVLITVEYFILYTYYHTLYI